MIKNGKRWRDDTNRHLHAKPDARAACLLPNKVLEKSTHILEDPVNTKRKSSNNCRAYQPDCLYEYKLQCTRVSKLVLDVRIANLDQARIVWYLTIIVLYPTLVDRHAGVFYVPGDDASIYGANGYVLSEPREIHSLPRLVHLTSSMLLLSHTSYLFYLLTLIRRILHSSMLE